MKKEGAILLGIGGDNSIAGRGTFFEGVLTSGYPSDATENAVQANIAAAGYASRQRRPPQGARSSAASPAGASTCPTPAPPTAPRSVWDCNGGTNQRWTYTAGKQLQVYGNKCLDANGQGTANGTQVIIWDCNGQTNQQWNVNANGTITGVQSGLCLDASARHRQQRLLRLQHVLVWHVSCAEDSPEMDSLLAGWRAAHLAFRRPPRPMLEGDWSAQYGSAAGLQLSRRGDVTAVFAANDQMAVGVLRAFA